MLEARERKRLKLLLQDFEYCWCSCLGVGHKQMKAFPVQRHVMICVSSVQMIASGLFVPLHFTCPCSRFPLQLPYTHVDGSSMKRRLELQQLRMCVKLRRSYMCRFVSLPDEQVMTPSMGCLFVLNDNTCPVDIKYGYNFTLQPYTSRQLHYPIISSVISIQCSINGSK